MISRIAYYVEGTRLFEWAMSVPIVVLAFCLFKWPQITSAPAFALFAWALPTNLIGVSLLICGLVCIMALIVNGASEQIGPRVRSWAALARAILMLQFGISTLQASMAQGFPFTVQPYWFTFAVVELYVAYRAVLDVRSPR